MGSWAVAVSGFRALVATNGPGSFKGSPRAPLKGFGG